MKLTCPGCGQSMPIEALLADGEAREVMAIALRLPAELAPRLLRYLALFRAPSRGLAWDRAQRLLAELAAPIERGNLARNGRTWPAPRDYWIAALDQVLDGRDRLVLPLKSHGYLFEVVVGIASKGEARAEAKREEAARAGSPAIRERPARAVRSTMPESVRAKLAQMGITRNEETP